MKKMSVILLVVIFLLTNMISCALPDKLSSQSQSINELVNLSDNKLYKTVISRIDHQIENHESLEEGFASLNFSQKVIYSIDYYEMEIGCGGLCQFFVNSSRMVAPFMSEYLAAIGAEEHKILYGKFIEENNIDLSDLSSFDIDSNEDYIALTQRYPFDEFDDTFYELESLKPLLIQYIRNNLNDF